MKKYYFSIFLFMLLIINNFFFNKKFLKEKFTSNFINEIVDKIYIINMDKDKSRMNVLDKKMKKLGLEYQRIPGVDGKKIYPKYKNKTTLRPGQLGCLLSHLHILEDAIKNKYDNILVLEDDILFHNNFHHEFKKKYNKLVKNEKKYDIIYLGCSQSLGGPGHWNKTRMKDEYYENMKSDGTFAMLINKNIFNDIINYAKNLKFPIDTSIDKNILCKDKYRTFTLFPHIITSNVGLLSNTEYNSKNLKNYFKSNKINMDDFDIST